MKVSFTVNNSSQWMEKMAKQIGSKVENHTLLIPEKLGDGYMKNYFLPNGMAVNFLNAQFYEPVTVCRQEGKNTLFSPVVFYIHEDFITQEIEGKRESIGYLSPRGIFWPSASITTTWQYPMNKKVTNIVIILDHLKLFSRINKSQNEYICSLINSEKSFYLFEHITPEMLILLKDITNLLELPSLSLSNDLLLEGKISQLLGLFIDLVNKRQRLGEALDMNTNDVNSLFKVKSALMKDLSVIPQVKELAESIGFSQSKLQKLFKQVFGKSLYQYALHERMLWAQKMLTEEKHSVSEIGYMLGYSNLSHFSKAFRNQFGVNPKSFAQNIYKKDSK